MTPEQRCLETHYALLGRLTAGVVHKLRNSINVSRNGAQVLLERGRDSDLHTKLLPVIVDAGRSMEKVLAAYEHLKVSHPPTIDIVQVLGATLDLLSLHSASIKVERHEWPKQALVASTKLHPALLYIVDTLLSAPGATKKISVFLKASDVEIAIECNADGISGPINSVFEELGGQVASASGRVVVSLPLQ